MLPFVQISILALFLYLTSGYAAPILEEKRSVSSSQLSTFTLIEQYAAAAYCSANNNSPANTKIACISGNCPLVQAANTTSVTEFQHSLKTDVTGFVAVDHTNQLVVVSFRGSESIKNWVANFDFTQTDTGLCDGCTAHQGFWDSWSEARDGVLAAIKSTANAYPKYKLVTTGHSLGGAIASLAAADLRNGGYATALYTFGAPRIAGQKLSDYISNQPGGNYRITHYNDPVPRLPLIPMGFVHISPEYYVNKPNYQNVAASDISVYTGNINLLQGNTAWVAVDILAHTWYFNSIAQCFINELMD